MSGRRRLQGKDTSAEVRPKVQISAEQQVRVGRELRQEREGRGIALEEIARGTRFSVRHLQSLEADLYDELPGGVLRKGIVRSYCRHMGLDEEHWLERFSEHGGLDGAEPDLAKFAENVHRARLEAMPPLRRRWWGVAAMAFFLLVFAAGIWRYVLAPRLGARLHPSSPQRAAPSEPAPARDNQPPGPN